jgi:nucleoside-diphosphate-sugar epimerase
MKQTYLITGASGFIGSALVRRLIDQHKKVHVILRRNSNPWRISALLDKVKIHISDLSKVSDLIDIIKEAKPNIVYHLAANGAYSFQKDADRMINTNILGTWNLLKACGTIDYDLFVNTGSSSEYGFKKSAMRETDIVEPASYYAVTKCAQTLLCSHVAKQEKRPIVTLRPFSVYGPFEEPRRFIPTLMKSLFLGRKMKLVAPDIARDQVYVDDVADAYLKIEELKRNSGEYFNIGTGVQSTIKDIVDMTVNITGKTTTFYWGRMKNRQLDTTSWVADISKAKSLLKWTPKTSLEEGLKKTWKWFQRNSQYYV